MLECRNGEGKEIRGCSNTAAANSESHVPCFQERVDTGTHVLSGCRGVSGLVPQPLCMKFKSAEADWNIHCLYHYSVPIAMVPPPQAALLLETFFSRWERTNSMSHS